MLQQDYILKLIEQLIKAILKTLFKMEDIDNIRLIEGSDFKNTYDKLVSMIDEGKINEAEDILFDVVDSDNKEDLQLALLFYSYLNTKDNKFLEGNNFSREEIKDGIVAISRDFGYGSFVDTLVKESLL